MGLALTQWERLEAILSRCFAALVAGDPESNVAILAFGSNRSSDGRREMLLAAVQAYFENSPIEGKPFDEFCSKLYQPLSKKRHEIAHGVVQPIDPTVKLEQQMFCTRPSYSDAKKLRSAVPYCYSKDEIFSVANQFVDARQRALKLIESLTRTPYTADPSE